MRKIKYIIAGISAAVFMVSCELDNFDGPDAQVYGAVIDAETEELIQQEIGTSGDVICPSTIFTSKSKSVFTCFSNSRRERHGCLFIENGMNLSRYKSVTSFCVTFYCFQEYFKL